MAKKGISQETIQYHYGKHHAGYVRKLNAQNQDGNVKKDASLEQLIKDQETSVKVFNLAAQIWNHTFYWESLSFTKSKSVYAFTFTDDNQCETAVI